VNILDGYNIQAWPTSEQFIGGVPAPPPETFNLITDTGANLITDTSDNLIYV